MIGSLGSNLAIGIALILRDQFSGPARQAGREIDNLKQRSQRAQAENARNVNAIGASTGIAALAGMREWVKVGAEFDKQMTYMYSISAKKAGINDRMLRDQAMNVGANTMFSTTEVGKAMVTMAQAGQNVEQIYKNINSTAVLAAATMSDIHSSASTMNDIMIGFNIPATEANSMRVADIITKSINDSNIQLSHFGESMKYVIPTATSLGISLEEVAAMISTIGNAGIKGSMAGTNLENLLRYLSRATGSDGKDKQGEALAMLGLSPDDLVDSTGRLRNMAEILPMIGKQLKTMSQYDTKGFNAMMDVLGVRGGRAGNLLANNFNSFSSFLEGVNNSAGTAQKTADDVMGSLWGTNEQLESTWENFKIVFTEAIEPVLVPLIKGLTAFINILRQAVQTPVGKWITAIAAGFILMRTMVMSYRAVVLTLQLAHRTLGNGFMSTSRNIVSGYNSMTAAAQRYAAAASTGTVAGTALTGIRAANNRYAYAGAIGAGAMGPAIWNASRKRWTSNNWAISNDAALSQRWMQRYGNQARLANIGNMVGKAAPWATIGGLGLQMGASAVGEDTDTGKVLNYAGGALSMAGTGAMIGSMVAPGIGTAVGGIIGAAGGVLMTYMGYLKKEEEKIAQAKAEADAATSENNGFDEKKWRVNTQKFLSMGEGEMAYRKGYAGGTMFDTTKQGANMWLNNGGIYPQNKTSRITINIDGKKAMDKSIDDAEYNQHINLGF